jgi:hypothetical protein
MEVTIAAGAVLDIPTTEEVRQIVYGYFKALSPKEPRVARQKGGDTMPASGVAVIDLGQPPAGCMWALTNIFLSGSDPTATVASAKAVIGAGLVPGRGTATTALDPISMLAQASAIPFADTFSRHEFPIYDNEHLFVAFSGAAQNTVVAVNAVVIEYQRRDAPDLD